jgi:hypothetical protein
MLRRILSLICLAGGFFWASVPAHAQGCILCYTSTLAAGKGVQDALRNGVLVLLVPVAMLMIATALLVWRRAAASATS